jgi:hypothetical protein
MAVAILYTPNLPAPTPITLTRGCGCLRCLLGCRINAFLFRLLQHTSHAHLHGPLEVTAVEVPRALVTIHTVPQHATVHTCTCIPHSQMEDHIARG